MKATLLLFPLSVAAFAPAGKRARSSSSMRIMSEIPENDVPFQNTSEEQVEPSPKPSEPKKSVMSQALPFLKCPPVLAESDLAGNVGFDPLGFSKNKEDLWHYREAEIKHARLAMLVCEKDTLCCTNFAPLYPTLTFPLTRSSGCCRMASVGAL